MACLVFVSWSWLIGNLLLAVVGLTCRTQVCGAVPCSSSVGSGLQFMPEKQIFPVKVLHKCSTGISLLGILQVTCVRMARAYLYLADVSPILKGVARSAPGSVMGMYRPHASFGVLEELCSCGLPPTPVKAGSDQFNSQKRQGYSSCTGGDRCVS